MKFDPVNVDTVTKPARAVFKVFLHCSASDHPEHDYAKVLESWHLARGFSEIGYHFFIRKSGLIETGRDIEKVPAAQEGHNTGSIAICCHGLLVDLFTEEQKHQLRALCMRFNWLYKGGLTFHGHCEVNAGKTCPVYDYRAWLGLDAAGRMS